MLKICGCLYRAAAMLAVFCLAVLSTPIASAGSVNVEAHTSGYWQISGNRNSTTNYITGGQSFSLDFYRSFQAFNVPAGYQFSAATITLSTYTVEGSGGTLELYDVATDPAIVTAFGGTGQLYIYDDLGTGTLLGSRPSMSASLSNSTVAVTLNAAGLAHLTANAGLETLIGFRMDGPVVAFSSSNASGTQRLALTAPAASMTSASVAAGPSAGGTVVTLTGANFGAAPTVTVDTDGNGTYESAATAISANPAGTQLTYTMPAGTAGAARSVRVVNSLGDTSTFAGIYTYVPAPTVTAINANDGTTSGNVSRTITGTNFTGATAVTIGGTAALSFTVGSATTIYVTVPPGLAGAAPVIVTTPGGSSSGSVTYLYRALINTISPSTGPVSGGQAITISGVGFTGLTGATQHVPLTSFTVVNDTTITAVTGPGVVDTSPLTLHAPTANFAWGGFYVFRGPPTVTGISPSLGGVNGGVAVIAGTNLANASVTFGGVASSLAFVNGDGNLQVQVPANSAGVKDVVVTTPSGSATLSNSYTYVDPATISAIAPTAGPLAGGTLVTITGTNFTPDTIVDFDDNQFTLYGPDVTVHSPTSLSFTTPAHAAGTVNVRVLTVAGMTAPVAGGYTYLPAPTAASLSPVDGPAAGGVTVTVTGANFSAGDTSVTIGGTLVPAASVTVNSPTSLSFTTPAHAAGNVAVSVTTPGGTSANIAGGYTYAAAPTITAISPAGGRTAGGNAIVITGTNFALGSSVTIDGVAATDIAFINSNTITAIAPAGTAGVKDVAVTTPGGSATLTAAYTYLAPPTITSISPNEGPLAGGQSVTISGTNFVSVGGANLSGSIGGAALTSLVVVNDTTITAVTPARTLGAKNVTIGTAGGVATLTNGYTYVAAPTLAGRTPTRGPAAGGTTVNIAGTNFSAVTEVTFNGVAGTSLNILSATQLTVVTPPGTPGEAAVAVISPGGTASYPDFFEYFAAPTATSLTPVVGPIAGGTAVTITGSGFSPANTSVSMDGAAISGGSVTVHSATSLTFTTPAHAADNVAVTVTTPGGTSAAVPGGFTYADAPTLSSLTPAGGPVTGGTVVTATGANFVPGGTSVTIDGTLIPAGSVTVNSATSLTFTTPAHAAGNVAVSVTTSGGSSAAVPGGFTYLNAPTVTALTPVAGTIAGGTAVTVTGTNFAPGDTTVTIGGTLIPAGSVTVNSATSLTFTTPAHAAGNVSVSVTTSGGSSAALPGGFTYLNAPTATALTPVAGTIAGGTAVTVTGTNFAPGDTTVTIGGTLIPAGSVTVNSATSLTFTTPAHAAGNVAVSVATSGGTSATVPGGFTYLAVPVATALSPVAGPVAGGTSVTITGANFAVGDTSVTIGGVVIPAGSITVNSAMSLTFTTPAHAAGNVAVSVATSGGTSANVPGGFTYVGAPTVSALLPAGGPISGGTSVTVTGANFVPGDTTVTIGVTLISAGSVTVNSPTSLTFTTPARSAGTVAVSVATAGGSSGGVPGGFTYFAVPTVASVTPNAGPPAGGQSVTITGQNLSGATVVTFGGVAAASIAIDSATQITAVTPAGTAGPKDLTVTTPGGSGTLVGGYTYGVPQLALTAGDLAIEGGEGGAGGWTVTSATTAYTVSNPGSDTLNWSATLPTFLSATPLSGALAPGGSVTLTPAPNAAANALAPGVYTGTIDITSNGGAESRGVTLTIHDVTGPVLATAPSNITTPADPGLATATVTYTAPTFTDNVAVTSVTRIAGPATGSAFPIGVTTVTHRAADAAGNTTDHSFTVTVTDDQPPVLAGVPSNITETVVAPTTSAVVTWTPPTATDNAPGVSVTQIAGPAPGASFPLGATTVTYRATDSSGNTIEGSFTVTINQIVQGTLTLNVETGEDGTFTFTSPAPGVTTSITTSGGSGASGPIAIPAGTYSLSFTVPSGFGVVSASCSAGSTLSAATQTGTFTIAPATATVCTIRTEDALGETAAVLGAHLETRASLILQNAPEVTRRLDRLTGTGGGAGGISGFGVTMGAGVLPFSMNLAADEMRFSMSLLGASRAEAGRLMPSRTGRMTGGVADPLGDSLFGMADDRLIGMSPASMDAAEPAFGAATGDALPGDPMAQRFDLWVEGRFARFDTPGGDGHFGILHLGADYLVTPGLLFGVGIQFDWLEQDTVLGGTIDSQGFLAGPYLTARLTENLFLDLRAAWGTADADVSPFGTYVDGVESDRTLVTAALIGDFEDGQLRIRPEARLTWYREETDVYVDGLNVAIPGFTVETGYFEFGPEFAYTVALRDGATLLPSLTFQGVWTFAQENSAAAPSNTPGLADTGLRGRVELGLAYAEPGFSIAAATYYDGVGDTDFEAWGAQLKLSVGF